MLFTAKHENCIRLSVSNSLLITSASGKLKLAETSSWSYCYFGSRNLFFSPSLFDFLLHKLRRDADCVLSICYRSIHRRRVNFLPARKEPPKFGDQAERLEPFIRFHSIRRQVLHCGTPHTIDINNPPILVPKRRLLPGFI